MIASMHLKLTGLLVALLCVTLASTGCTINNNGQGNEPVPGDVSFHWSFSGTSAGRCADVPEVKSIRITIPGQTLANGGVLPCNTAGVDGITLRDFAPGRYSYTVDALGGADEVLYSGGGSFSVDGDEQVTVSLARVVHPPVPGDVSFRWSFAGAGSGHCVDVPDVKSIRISIPGETLPSGGVYPCDTAGVDGIILYDFSPGTYDYALEALSSSGQVLYSGSGSFTVNGSVLVDATLTPRGGENSYAYLSWTFPANGSSWNPTCTQAGVVSVDVSIDGGAWSRLDCTEGWNDSQVVTPYLTQGSHTLAFIGWSSGGQPYYYATGAVETRTGAPVAASFQLGAVGGMAIRWELFDGSSYETCAEAGLTGMAINLLNKATGELVFGIAGDTQSCDGAPIIYSYLAPGDYEVYVHGLSGSTVAYANDDSPMTVTVTAFQQKTAADAVTLTLLKQ